MKKFFTIIALVSLSLLLSTPAVAHSGSTNADGGHTDHSTGEYHYHHGYSAHDHYDMDGDGDIDCPYNFDDRTDHSNHSNNNGGSRTNKSRNNRTSKTIRQESYVYSYISISIAIAFLIIVNWIAIHNDRTDPFSDDNQLTTTTVILRLSSSVIVFLLLFFITYLVKRPLQLRAILFAEMFAFILINFTFLLYILVPVVGGITTAVNYLLCRIFKVKHIWPGHFYRLTIPLTYAFIVFLFLYN